MGSREEAFGRIAAQMASLSKMGCEKFGMNDNAIWYETFVNGEKRMQYDVYLTPESRTAMLVGSWDYLLISEGARLHPNYHIAVMVIRDKIKAKKRRRVKV